MLTPKRGLQAAIGTMLLLTTVAANFLSPFTSLWTVGAVMVTICALGGAIIVWAILRLQAGELYRWSAIGGIAFLSLLTIGALVRLPPELDSGATNLAILMANDAMERRASMATAAQEAFEYPNPERRRAMARNVYLLSGAVVSFRDENGQVQRFIPDATDKKRVEEITHTQAVINAAIDDYVRNRFGREVVKLVGAMTLIVSMCAVLAFAKPVRAEATPIE